MVDWLFFCIVVCRCRCCYCGRWPVCGCVCVCWYTFFTIVFVIFRLLSFISICFAYSTFQFCLLYFIVEWFCQRKLPCTPYIKKKTLIKTDTHTCTHVLAKCRAFSPRMFRALDTPSLLHYQLGPYMHLSPFNTKPNMTLTC